MLQIEVFLKRKVGKEAMTVRFELTVPTFENGRPLSLLKNR